jgi:uncharacterized membrane protein
MKKVAFYLVVLIFLFSVVGVLYNTYTSKEFIDRQLVENTKQTAIIVMALQVKLESTAADVKTNLDATNSVLFENQERLKTDMKEVIAAQIAASTKDLLDKSVYNKDMELLNEKLNRLLEKK